MPYFEICICILLGLVIGSFVNVCIDRLPLQFAEKDQRSRLLISSELSPILKNHLHKYTLTLFKPTRSFCFYCGYQLRWFENVPMLSYILIKGRCRKCNTALGSRIFWTETIHGLGYGISGWLFQNWICSLIVGLNFSFLWISAFCWTYKQARIKLYYTGVVLLAIDFLVSFLIKK